MRQGRELIGVPRQMLHCIVSVQAGRFAGMRRIMQLLRSRQRLLILLSLVVMGVATATPVISQTGNNFNTGAAGGECCGFVPDRGSVAAVGQGCYVGTGADDRVIRTAVKNPGVTYVGRKNNTTPEAKLWNIPVMGAGQSCYVGNTSPVCDNNRIQNVADGLFEVGTNPSINGNSQNYCWLQWEARSGYHGTGVYTGNGSSPRDISVANMGCNPSMVWVQNGGPGFPPNEIFSRTPEMPPNQCMPLSGAALGGVTDGITTTGMNKFTVSTRLNNNTSNYSYAWWCAAPGYMQTTSWIGNGANTPVCASAANTQDITTASDPTVVLAMVSNTGPSTCGGAFHSGTAAFRMKSIRFGIAGPGALSGNDLYSFRFVSNPDGDDGLGPLGVKKFMVTGAPSLELSFNDDTYQYYATAWFPDTPVAASISAPDWRIVPRMLAYWTMEEASNTTRNNTNNTLGCPGTDCSLANNGSVDLSTVNFKEGLGAAESSASGDKLTCALATCNELKDTAATAISWGGWLRSSSAGDTEFIESEAGATQYRSLRRGGTSQGRCTVRDSAFSDIHATSGTWANNTFAHQVCTWTNSGTNTLANYLNGVFGTSATTANEMLAIGAGNFEVNSQTATANTQVDEVFVWNGTLSATDICRIHACGWRGEFCSCYADFPTEYVDTGRWVSGTCTLPACNKNGPS